MPEIQIDDRLSMYYEEDWFGDPWVEPETVLLIHGLAESSLAWYAWVPTLGESYRVIRPDLVGFGQSSKPGSDYDFSLDRWVRELDDFTDRLGIDHVHVVGAKLGGTVAYKFALTHPEKTTSVTAVSPPVKMGDYERTDATSFADMVDEMGFEAWVEASMRKRLGSDADPAMVEWWTEYMIEAGHDMTRRVMAMYRSVDVSDAIATISAPVLTISTSENSFVPADDMESWQPDDPRSTFVVIDDDSFHPAAVKPHECLEHVVPFLAEHSD